MEEEAGLPSGLCCACSDATISSIQFRELCNVSLHHWTRAVTNLSQIEEPTEEDKTYYVFYNGTEETLVRDQISKADNTAEALETLNKPLCSKKRRTERVKRCTCPDCGRSFMMPFYLNEHLKNSLKRACTTCGIVVQKEMLAQHLLDDHKKVVLNCHTCHKICDDPEDLKEHIEEFHSAQSITCQVCGSGFVNARALRAHAYAHSLFHCSNCKLSFENRRCYKHHQKQCVKTVTIEKQRPYIREIFVCDHCGSRYDKKPSLRIHIIQKHLNVLPYVCDTCGKRASTLAHLRSHEATHTTERKIFQCDCGARMRTELGYQLHLRIHSGERPYQCDECGDRFLSSSRRLDHIKRRHRSTKDMPHGCEECSARFVRPFELKKHYMTVHNSTVYDKFRRIKEI